MNYYNDIDPTACAWLKELIKAGIIPPGDIDDRSIKEVQPSDLSGYTQCHFFAGVGGWPIALGLAGWGADRPVWTGSCPCQSLSVAGLGKGHEDERHLWPQFARLICESEPPVVFGEQVASALGREWLAGVRLDLEEMGYAVGAADLCAAGVGAPHIRQRLWWVADADRPKRGQIAKGRDDIDRNYPGRAEAASGFTISCKDIRLADMHRNGRDQGRPSVAEEWRYGVVGNGGACGGVEDTERIGWRGRDDGYNQGEERGIVTEAETTGSSTVGRVANPNGNGRHERRPEREGFERGDAPVGAGFWNNAILIPCADEKARRIEPGLAPLVDGLPGRASLLRGYGNAIVPQVAAEFIKANIHSFDEVMR